MPRGHILDLRWNALLDDFRRSGLTHAEFCQRRSRRLPVRRDRNRNRTRRKTPSNPLSGGSGDWNHLALRHSTAPRMPDLYRIIVVTPTGDWSSERFVPE
jgi:hypothetical protein